MLAASAFASCRDEAATSVTGAYTFKTGGQVKVLPTVLAADSVDAVAACSALSGYDLTDLWAPLMPESGQMNLVYTNEAKDSVILTFTALMGDLCTTLAESYDEIGQCVGEDRRGEISSLELHNFVDPSVAEPLISVQGKLGGLGMGPGGRP